MSLKQLIPYYILAFLTPIVWLPVNYELFEYNKMTLVYFAAIIIATSWVAKMVSEKKLILRRTPLDLPILLFLLANLLSTIFSIDPHTSFWGYYSRQNGGLLSIISYTTLYYAVSSNLDSKHLFKILHVTLFSGFLVSIYGILQHYGIDKDFWVQDVQARVFSTLGQPNWLAAYLAMLIFPAIYFFVTCKSFLAKIYYFLLTISLYAAFTFTFSRGGTLGLVSGILVLLTAHPVIYGFMRFIKKKKDLTFGRVIYLQILAVIGAFLIVNIFYGSAWTRFKLLEGFEPIPKASSGSVVPSNVTQLENGGTESGQIRLIVWKGAMEIFKHYPIFGSGVETFAYSYYKFRPIEHNFVSEWDFLYNKAHNEYLNYLATTGLFGFLAYIALIVTFISWTVIRLIKEKTLIQDSRFLILISLLASYISYLVQNIFGFSVVIIALYFYLFPAFAFIFAGSLKDVHLDNKFQFFRAFLENTIYRRKLYKNITIVLVIFCGVLLTYSVYKRWSADTVFARGSNFSDSGNVGQAYNYLSDAVSKNSGEPLYRSELGYAAAAAALALSEDDATRSSELKEEAIYQTEKALNKSPNNSSLWRTAIRTYYAVSALDPSFNQKTIEVTNKAIELSPTDAKLYFNKALILDQLQRKDEAIVELEKAIKLRPNYPEAHFTLGQLYEEKGDKEKAKIEYKAVLTLIPDNSEAQKKLEELEIK